MSALEEYRHELTRIGKELQPRDWNDGASTIAEFADAAIAELETALDFWQQAHKQSEVALDAERAAAAALGRSFDKERERRLKSEAAVAAAEELIEELDPYHLKRNRMGLCARAEEKSE